MILGLLKDETRYLHDQIERRVDLPTRLRSSEHFASLLAQFYGFYDPLEKRLNSGKLFATAGLDFQARSKTALLRDDLAGLGWGDDILSLPQCENLPVVADTADVLGCMYVLEGATLGGQVVVRQVERQLHLVPGRGCSFFGSYGERVGEMWREFCCVLTDYATSAPGTTDRIIAAAVGTFSCLDRWVAEGGAC